MIIHTWNKLIRADDHRKTRFHTERGDLCVDPRGMFYALATTVVRLLSGHTLTLPWLTFDAIRYLAPRIAGKRLFEYGSGKSTAWYARRCTSVVAVEHNPTWHRQIAAELTDYQNAQVFLANGNDYIRSIDQANGPFDVIVVDGIERPACVAAALRHLAPGGFLVIDNTDRQQLHTLVSNTFRRDEVLRFPGWIPGNFHPSETSVVTPASHQKST